MNKAAVAGAGIVGVVALSGCSTNAASDEVYVHKGNGVFENKGEKGCVLPAQREIQGAMDDYYAYPANQRVYAFTGAKGDDGTPFDVVSKDGQPLQVPGTVSFSLNIDCKTLHKFHDKIGNRYQAYMSDGQTSEGWSKMLNIYFRPALDATLDRVAKQYGWNELRSDPKIKDAINAEVNSTLTRLIDQQLEGNEKFFVNISALIQQPRADQKLVESIKAAEQGVAAARAAEAKAVADAKTAQAKAMAEVSQKQAELRVAQIEAQIRAAEIRSYGGPEAWAKYKAVEKGINPWMPSYSGGTIVDPPK